MKSLVLEGDTWEAYEKLRKDNRQLHNKLCKLIKEMLRSDDLTMGTGKPEPLKHQYTGCWSRRISSGDRLVYRFDDDSLYILAIGGHYDA